MAIAHRSPNQTVFILSLFSLDPFSFSKIHWRLKPKVHGEKALATFDQNRNKKK